MIVPRLVLKDEFGQDFIQRQQQKFAVLYFEREILNHEVNFKLMYRNKQEFPVT